jgi:L-ascorbate metabolism protein UlaG (beta-lactamase superfamily)
MLSFLLFSCCIFSTEPYVGPISGHFNGKNFSNAYLPENRDTVHKAIKSFLSWRFKSFSPEWNVKPNEKPGSKPPIVVNGDSMRVTFIGHSTVLLQFDGLNFITDPVFSSMISPVPFIGQTRKRIPGIRIEDLPPIDAVLISHNHYDHLDISSLKKINKFNNSIFITCLGNKKYLNDHGFNNVIEMDWYDSVKVRGRTVHISPASHFSMRGLCDRNTSLWCGFVIETSGGPVYYAGDTGYGLHFKELNRLFPRFRLSIIPISPIEPRAFMTEVHISPSEAVLAHIDLDSRLSMPIHFSTFKQGTDKQTDPIYELVKAIKKLKVSSSEWMMPAHGKGVYVP